MRKILGTPSSENPFSLFEIHSYDGGFKPELVPAGPRPDFFPDPAGPRSNELELAEGDYAVELIFSIRKKRRVVWLGYYTFGTDRQLGRRGNYSGVGIWLIDLAPIYVGRVLKFLREAALEISRNQGVTQTARDKLSALAADAELGWYVPYEQLPNQFWTARFAASDVHSSTYFAIPEDEKLGLSLIAADVLHHFSKKPRADIVSPRYLYLLRRSSKVPQNLVTLELSSVLASEEDAVWDFCEAAAEPIARQNEVEAERKRLLEQLSQTNQAANIKIQELDHRCVNLKTDLIAANTARDEILRIFNSVSTLIPNIANAPNANGGGSDGSGVMARLQQGIEDISDKLVAIDLKISRLRGATSPSEKYNEPPKTWRDNPPPAIHRAPINNNDYNGYLSDNRPVGFWARYGNIFLYLVIGLLVAGCGAIIFWAIKHPGLFGF